MLKFAEFRAFDQPPKFNQADVTRYRAQMILQIGLGKFDLRGTTTNQANGL